MLHVPGLLSSQATDDLLAVGGLNACAITRSPPLSRSNARRNRCKGAFSHDAISRRGSIPIEPVQKDRVTFDGLRGLSFHGADVDSSAYDAVESALIRTWQCCCGVTSVNDGAT